MSASYSKGTSVDARAKVGFLKREPKAKPYFFRWLGSDEFLNGWERWCLWLGNCPPDKLKQMPLALERVNLVRKFRLESKRAQTLRAAEIPSHFATELIPKEPYILVPKVSSERRHFIPIGFMGVDTLVSDLVFMVPKATPYHFGILSSTMHNAWVRRVCGRLKSDYRYSKDIVYNNYPWPENPSVAQKQAVEAAAQGVLDARAGHMVLPAPAPQGGGPPRAASLADLYDPLTMPPDLVKAHRELDRAVDKCYRPQPFPNDTKRVEYLFELYDKYTSGLLAVEKVKKKRKKKNG